VNSLISMSWIVLVVFYMFHNFGHFVNGRCSLHYGIESIVVIRNIFDSSDGPIWLH